MNSLIAVINNFFSDFSRQKLFLLVFLASLLAVLLSLIVGGFAATAILLIPTILSILQITKGVWTPEGGGKSAVGLASLGVALVAILTNRTWRPILDSLLEPLFSKYPVLKDRLPTDSPSMLGLVFLAVVILIVNYFSRDKSAMKQHSTPLEKEFPERNYKQLLDSFCGVLLADLRDIDRETNWSAEMFVPLEAEVEIQGRAIKKRRITDLLTAIRSDRTTRAFLILGDPGSGKSVALRKLCRELLSEVGKTGKVPLYVNLKEWTMEEPWTEDNPPQVNQLYDFVISNLKLRGDVFTSDFIDKYFLKMFENGRLFFVFDSFDEIPAVLDESENSWLIDELSSVIFRFLSGAHHSRGILASRIFRRPTANFDAKSVLEIRPFSEKRIVQTLKRSLSFDDTLVTQLFTTRRDLVPIARNPFSAALISSYAKEHDNALPVTQAELYASYINRRLDICDHKIQSKALTHEEVIYTSTEIAFLMFKSERSGLEASVNWLEKQLNDLPIAAVIEILTYARLGRLGGGLERRFSFVHRRFNEYFVVQKLMRTPSEVPTESIPRDSRWRDALVLYCEVADDEQAERIALFCWNEIKKISSESSPKDPQYLAAVHCLRFLRDAFRTRSNCIEPFRYGISDFIMTQISGSGSLLSKKLAVEAVGLLYERDVEKAIQAALIVNNQWVGETALKACYYLPRLTQTLLERLILHIDRLDTRVFIAQRSELSFSFKLSNAFGELRKFCTLRFLDCMGLILLFILVGLVYPLLGLGILIFLYIQPDVLRGPSENRLARVVAWRLSIPGIVVTALGVMFWLDSLLGIAGQTMPSIGLAIPHAFWIGLFLAVPWYQVYTYRRHFFSKPNVSFPSVRTIQDVLARIVSSITIRRLLWSIGLLLSLGILILGAYILLPHIPKSVKQVIGVLVASAVIYNALRVPFENLYWRVKDRRRTESFFKVPNVDRKRIAAHLMALKSYEGRIDFIAEIEARKIHPSGDWPDYQLPNFHNDEASSRLAQLEERWLGLSR